VDLTPLIAALPTTACILVAGLLASRIAPSWSLATDLIMALAVVAAIRALRMRWLTLQLYYYVKQLTKAEPFEAYKAQRRRYAITRRQRRAKRIAGSGGAPDTGTHLPSHERIAAPGSWVRLLAPWWLIWPLRRHIGGAAIRWSPFCDLPDEAFRTRLKEEVAHFLGCDPAGLTRLRSLPLRLKILAVRPGWADMTAVFVRRGVTEIPDRLPFQDAGGTLPEPFDEH